MRALAALLVSFSLVSLTVAPANAAPEKTLANLKGDVSFQAPNGAKVPVASKASIALQDAYSAITGANSEGAIGLPDSSRVLVGQNSTVQLVSFNQAGITSANFVVVGKVRFSVQHPGGAHASYTFTTGTAQIAVRGTTGDISWDPITQTLQVNCYELTDPTLPVQVTFADGSVITLGAGQSLIAHLPLNPSDPPHVQNVDQPLYSTFAEFGLPDNAKQLGLIHHTWFAAGGWLLLIPIILVITNHHPKDGNPPTSNSFPVGIGIHIGPKP